jgi:F0F1-type ATP synthase membrane subunit b/b'|tara:strand:- start:2074 stop:2253 length:180 start_codon:yes stop_codon:yes gene_type:complete
MKQKIIFYLLIFSLLINVFLVTDYGKRLNYSQSKIESQYEKIKKLQDSIELMQTHAGRS